MLWCNYIDVCSLLCKYLKHAGTEPEFWIWSFRCKRRRDNLPKERSIWARCKHRSLMLGLPQLSKITKTLMIFCLKNRWIIEEYRTIQGPCAMTRGYPVRVSPPVAVEAQSPCRAFGRPHPPPNKSLGQGWSPGLGTNTWKNPGGIYWIYVDVDLSAPQKS